MPQSERTTICPQCQKLVGPGLICKCIDKVADDDTIKALEELRDSLKEHKESTVFVPGLGLFLLLTLSMVIAVVGSAITMMK
jgi:hypothetical protein